MATRFIRGLLVNKPEDILYNWTLALTHFLKLLTSPAVAKTIPLFILLLTKSYICFSVNIDLEKIECDSLFFE